MLSKGASGVMARLAKLAEKRWGGFTFKIDRPKGFVKKWDQPDGSIKEYTYPVDYGYFVGHVGEDDEGLDAFVGSDPEGPIESFLKLKPDPKGGGKMVPDETKFLIGLTPAERKAVLKLYQDGELIDHTEYDDVYDLMETLTEFRTAKKVASRWVGAAHGKNVALMRFLSGVSQRLGFGQDVYVVGGAVRNWVINQPIKDIDLLVDTVALGHSSEWVAQQIAKAIPVETNLTTNQYGVAILTVKGDWDLDGHPMNGEVIEIAAARKESYGGEGGKGYKPHMVEPATVQEDVVRREFSFNTLMWRLLDLAKGPESAQIIDLTGCGLRDLQEGTMRCPADPDKVFSDDPSRLIRIVKFVSRYGFKLTPDTEAAAKRNAPKLVNVPHNAVSKLLAEVLVEAKAKQAVALMDRLGLLDVVRKMVETIPPFREALNNWGNAQSVQYMFDLMDIGLVTKAKVGFLTPEQQKRVREIAVTLGAEEAEQFLAVLKQPGKVLDMVGMASELGLAGAAMKNLMDAARNVLLAHPEWVHNPATWTAHTKGTYMRQFTKAAFATVQQRVATRYLQAFQFGLAQAFADQVGMPDRMNLAKLDRLFRDAFLDAFKDLGYSLEGTLTPGRTNWISLRGEGHPNSPSYEETEVEVLESAFGTVADSFRADVFVRNFLVPSAPTQFFRQHEKQIVAFFLNAQNEKQINLFLRSMQSEVLGKLGDTLTHESLGAETADLFEQHSSAGLEPLEASSTVVTDFVAIVKRPLFIVRAKVVLKYDPKEVRPDRG